MEDMKKELEELFNDPLLDVSQDELALFDLSEPLKKAKEERKEADYVAQRRPCEDFHLYEAGFKQVHEDLRSGKRLLKRFTAKSLQEEQYYVVSGTLVYLEKIQDRKKAVSRTLTVDGRTRTIYENGTESDVLLQTLAKSIYSDGYVVTENTDSTEESFNESFGVVTADDVHDGYIYVLSSLSEEPAIAKQKDLYKIGFCTTTVEERIRGCEYDPTYLMDKVRIVRTWKTYNMKTHVLEDILHKFFHAVQFKVKVQDLSGKEYSPREWFVVPLGIIEKVIELIDNGKIVDYRYNHMLQVLEKVDQPTRTVTKEIDTTGWAILTLNIKQVYFDRILKGEKTVEYRDIKPSTTARYTWVDASTGSRYLRKFDALRLCVGRGVYSDKMLVEVVDTVFDSDAMRVEYHLGKILQVDIKNE